MAGGSKSKQKGNNGERELATILASIFGGSFVRVPNSGAFTGRTNAFRKKDLSDTQNRIYRGDIIPPDFLKHFFIECKSYATFPFHQLLMNGAAQLDEWLEQTISAVDPLDVFFIAFKIKFKGWFVAAPQGLGYAVGNHCCYQNKDGQFLITQLGPFFERNCDLIKTRCAA